ncbi:hypothetical protein BIW11_05557 [Tropilaelaps mercedesae]|uniref:Intraflagellar transport protein 20-like n=1 Tax=Tropilaelaps mercedesae TaxID=418985 RepID=A0A1V9Y265_9ACAR|nr:hypothetical protein BIW11_05557 [Tropilaelaps mercedesae]
MSDSASEVLAELGLFADEEMSQLKLLDPQNDHSALLREYCKKFLTQMGNFSEITEKFLKISDELSEKVDQERMKAVVCRKRLMLVNKEKERQRLQLEQLLLERKVQLERLHAHGSSLGATREELNAMLAKAQG